MIPNRKLQELMEDGTIQIAPLAYMRGRTLDRACVILDEAQNTNIGQLKMFLTRMGCNAKFIVTGDASQVDLPHKEDSGLLKGVNMLKDIKGISTIEFSNDDIVRHPLVNKIVKAFDHADIQQEEGLNDQE
jgi:phosphate starvation-inducible PhoH-like protein